MAAVNYRGVGESIKVNIAITLVELSGLLFIIAVGAKVLFSGDGDPGQAFEFKGSGFGALTGITAGAATAFYAFIGFEDSVNMAEEVRDPVRTFPPALLTGIVAASIIYLLVGFTAAMTVPLDVLTESSGPLLEVVHIGLPDYDAGTLFSVIAMIAVSNTMLINMLMASRLLYGMANQGVLPAPFAWVSPRKTPWFGILFTTALSILLILTTEDLTGLSDTTVLLLTSVFFLVNICVLVLRRDPVGHSHFVAPTILPIIGGRRGPGVPAAHQPDRRDLPHRHLPADRRPGPVGGQLPRHPAHRHRGRRAGPDHRPRGRRPALSRAGERAALG